MTNRGEKLNILCGKEIPCKGENTIARLMLVLASMVVSERAKEAEYGWKLIDLNGPIR